MRTTFRNGGLVQGMSPISPRLARRAYGLRGHQNAVKVGVMFMKMRHLGVETPAANISFVEEDGSLIRSYMALASSIPNSSRHAASERPRLGARCFPLLKIALLDTTSTQC